MKKFWALFKRDCQNGIGSSYYSYLFFVVLAFLGCNQFHSVVKMFVGPANIRFHVWDYMCYFMYGAEAFKVDIRGIVDIPLVWMCFVFSLHYTIAYYAEYDFKENGRQVIASIKSRVMWWLGKCVWCLSTVMIYFGIMFLTVMISSFLLNGYVDFGYDGKSVSSVLSAMFGYLLLKDIPFIALLLPFLVVLSMSLLQVFLSFVFGPVPSYICVCCVYIASVFYNSEWLIGNYAMVARCGYLVLGGFNPIAGVVYAFIIIAFAVFGGILYFERKDVL